MEGAVQWWVGDALNFGEKKYGEMYSQALTDAEEHTWQQYAYISRRFESSTRVELSWSHHREVASLPPETANELLQQAVREKLSSRDLKVAAKRAVRELGRGEAMECCQTNDLHALIAGGKKFACIYADPPWQYDNQGTRAATGSSPASGPRLGGRPASVANPSSDFVLPRRRASCSEP